MKRSSTLARSVRRAPAVAFVAFVAWSAAACQSGFATVDEAGRAVLAAVVSGDDDALLDLYPRGERFLEDCGSRNGQRMQMGVDYARAAVGGRFEHHKNPISPDLCRSIPPSAVARAVVSGGEFVTDIDRGVETLDGCDPEVIDLGHIKVDVEVDGRRVRVMFDAVRVDGRYYLSDRVGCYAAER